ncbi:TRAP transporter large permease [Arsenicitalea aurantiaca]|uniref:TRAP transporter large permease protein n=1 Tax=Arsenicitalea aurantiaca TaxID=1783274 RepID=A0A433XL30_9HYPH|nr:TRAP transporter large permease [Arsenicitalea aurantiaca]RUT34761.1 TRAP transporter large permease [Arsenicitalea aurantiaca]
MTLLGSLFFGLLVFGVPVAFVLGGAATLYIVLVGGVPLSTVPQRIFAGLDQFVLMSIPFFILAGFLMNEAQLTGRLVQFANYMVGRWRAGLAQVNVVTSLFFGGITGAATADVAAIGPIMIPAMVKQGYSRENATAVTVASSIVGPLLPPSIPMLVYGISSGASIGSLFLAGVTPGLVAGFAMLALNRYLFRHMAPTAVPLEGAGSSMARITGFFASLRIALVALAMPLIIVGGVVGGVFTPTESSVAAVLYAGIVGLAMRTMGLRVVARMIGLTAILSATIMLIVAGANLLGWVLAFERVPQAIAEMFLSLTDNRWVFLLMVMAILLVVGLFLETSGAIIILTPVLLPSALAYGFDPIHFGVVIVFGLVIGLITPPVGLCLFVGCSVGGVQLHRLARAVTPYMVLLIVVYAFFAFVPQASTWLPSLLNPIG